MQLCLCVVACPRSVRKCLLRGLCLALETLLLKDTACDRVFALRPVVLHV